MFSLSDHFIGQYRGKQPNWGFGDLSYFVYKRTYAREKDNGQQEEYWETCQRVVEGVFSIQFKHCKSSGLEWKARKAQASAQKMFQKMWEFKFLPPGRGLWLMGTKVIDKIGSAGLNNCGFISTSDIGSDFSMPFCWAADMLMLGVGVGFDTRGANKPTIYPINTILDSVVFNIPDTREGWVDAICVLLESYTKPDSTKIIFNFDLIRKAGMPIRGFGGIASGPEPLKEGLESIRSILDAASETLTSIEIVDIFNFIGKLVVSGNVRRSAQIAHGEEDDLAFIRMKDPKIFQVELNDRRWASNNSIFVQPDSNFDHAVSSIIRNGEPGLIFLENARHYGRMKDGFHKVGSSKYDEVDGFNPCAEQGLRHGELCCLVETFPANHESAEEYYETLKYAFMYAKTVTLVPTHNSLTNQIMISNRRIGLSMSGIQQALKKFGFAGFFENFCDEGYGHVQHWDRIYSRWWGIPQSIKSTTVKPSGTVSLLAGATPGVHCSHSEFYMRTFRVGAIHPLVAKLVAANYKMEFSANDKAIYIKAGGDAALWCDTLEISKVSDKVLKGFANGGGSLVTYFPVKEDNFTKSKFDISLWEQLCLARELQDKWSDNSVSITVTFKKEEQKDLKSAIEYLAPYIKTLSFLPLEIDNYPQMPYTQCSEAEYDEYSKGLKKLRLTSLRGGTAKGERFCTNDVCEL